MRKNGFTLIELMIVIAIVGILLAVIVPAFTKHDNTTAAPQGTVVADHPNFKTCEFEGLDPANHSVFKCPDGKLYTQQR